MWGIIGHEWGLRVLASSIAKGSPSHAYLLAGPAHIGKTTLALGFAKALNCTGSTVPCGQCLACRKIDQGTHPDVRLISGEGKAIGIDRIREIQRQAVLRPFEGRYRVHILSSFHNATPEAANCLLKTLEEPARHEVLVLTAPEADLLLPTVVSRCQVLSLHLLPTPAIREALETRLGLDSARATLLARLSGGRIGWALTAATDSEILTKREQQLDQLRSLLSLRGVHRWSHVRQLSAPSTDLKGLLGLWSTWWRDLLMLKAGCPDRVINLDRQEDLAGVMAQYDRREIVSALKSTCRAQEQLEHNVNARLALEVLLLDYPGGLAGGRRTD